MIERDELCTLIPHAGSMCLLDRVEHWDQTSIRCISSSHLQSQNPLRTHDQLAAVYAIEYAAQAMAVHGGLLARGRSGHHALPLHKHIHVQKQDIQPVPGFIAALRDIRLHVDYLHDKPGSLHIRAEALLQNANAMIYSFQIMAGDTAIADGRITVMIGS